MIKILVVVKKFLSTFLNYWFNFLVHFNELFPVTLNVLSIKQTMLEKLVSLFRTSFEQDLLNNISRKIHHFYDLYYLFNSIEGKDLIESDDFKLSLDKLWKHDKTLFDEPLGWKDFSYEDSPLFRNFDTIWNKIAKVYKSEISALAFAEIPSGESISKSFHYIFENLS